MDSQSNINNYLISYLDVTDELIVYLDQDFDILVASSEIINHFGWCRNEIKCCNITSLITKKDDSHNALAELIPLVKREKNVGVPTIIKPWKIFKLASEDNLHIGWALSYMGHLKPPKENESNDSYLDYLEKIADAMPGNFYWKDRAGRYLGCNKALLDALNLSRGEFIGKTDYDLWPDQAKQLREHDKRVMESGSLLRLEEEVTLRETEHYYYSVIKIPLKDGLGNIMGIIGNSLDITKQIELQKQFNREKKKSEAASQAKSEFIANMSHDLRTPMSGVSGMLGAMMFAVEDAETGLQSLPTSAEPLVLQRDKLLGDLVTKTREYTTVAQDSSNELIKFFNEILEIVQLDAGKGNAQVASFDVSTLLQRNIKLLQPVALDKKLKLSLAVTDDVPQYLHGMSHYLDRTLTNLISNALKFTKEGGVKVSIDLGDECDADKPKDTVCVRICVSDTGIGIPKDKFDEIFGHFSRLTSSYQGVYKGAGLGLHAVKQYVEAMGGEIKVDSEVDKGSKFTVTMPFKVADHSDQTSEETIVTEVESKIAEPSKEPEATAQTITQEDTGAARAHVLLVEDGISAAMAAKLFLQRCQCTVDIAQDGAQALTKASENIYDLILMDVGLPDMEGTEVARRIRELTDTEKSQVPIVALTGHAGNAERCQQCLDVGMQQVLMKPLQFPALQSVLQQYAPVSTDTDAQSDMGKAKPSSISALDEMEVIDLEGSMQILSSTLEFTKELLSMLAEDLKEAKQKIAQLYADKEMTLLGNELHRIRGSVCYLKLPQLAAALDAFEGEVRAESQDEQQLEDTHQQLQQAITTFLLVWAKMLLKGE